MNRQHSGAIRSIQEQSNQRGARHRSHMMDCRMVDSDSFDSFHGEWTTRHQRAKIDYDAWLVRVHYVLKITHLHRNYQAGSIPSQ